MLKILKSREREMRMSWYIYILIQHARETSARIDSKTSKGEFTTNTVRLG